MFTLLWKLFLGRVSMRTSEERGGETEREFKKENKFKFVIEGPKQICFHLL